MIVLLFGSAATLHVQAHDGPKCSFDATDDSLSFLYAKQKRQDDLLALVEKAGPVAEKECGR